MSSADSAHLGRARVGFVVRRWAVVFAVVAFPAGLLAAVPALAGPAVTMAAAAATPADQDSPRLRLQPGLRTELASGRHHDFWVDFAAHPNLERASGVRGWSARGAAVVDTLRTAAATSQRQVREQLRSSGVEFTPLWVDNSLYVHHGTLRLAHTLARDPAVSAIHAAHTYRSPSRMKGVRQAQVRSVEWGIAAIGADRVWDEYGDTGRGIVVGSIDTGVQFDHPALVAAYRGTNGDGTFSHDHNWYDPTTLCGSPSSAPCDNAGHGTHTVGTMVGDGGDGNHIGVAPGAQWIAAKGCEDNGCSDLSLGLAAQWMLAPTKLDGTDPDPALRPNVINNSWGVGQHDPWYQDYVEQWVAAGIFPTFAVGNHDDAGCGTQSSPGDYPESYAVGAVDSAGEIADFSARGSADNPDAKPDITAPGVDVRSSVPSGEYAVEDGTSMAAPHVAGTVALMWSAAPSLVGHVAETRALLDQSAHDRPDTRCGGTAGDNNVYGEGTLDAYAAVAASPRPGTGAVTGTVTDQESGNPIGGATVSVDGPQHRAIADDADGSYRLHLDPGAYTLTVSEFDHTPQSFDLTVTSGEVVTQDVALATADRVSVSGLVRDGSGHHWPLYAALTADGVPGRWFTDPDTGRFHVDLPVDRTYHLTITPRVDGYQPLEQDVTVGDDDASQDFNVNVDPDTCGAPGYTPANDGVRAGFDNPSVPDGWDLVDHQGSGQVWRFDDPGQRGNLTGGEGGFATVDSDWLQRTGTQDTSLVTPHLDLSDAQTPVVEFNSDVKVVAGTRADVDVSLDGGNSWQTVWTRSVPERGPQQVRVPLPQAAGQPDVQVRWHFHVGHWSGWWQVDHAFVGNHGCAKIRGGLVHGVVTDANTDTPVVGATVTDDQGSGAEQPDATTTTVTTPDDDAVPDGYFTLFTPGTGVHALTAAKHSYAAGTRVIDVQPDWNTGTDLELTAGRLTVRPRNVTARTTLGRQVTRRVTITNTGTAPATYHLSESQRGLTIQRADGTRLSSRQVRSAGRVPVRTVRVSGITPGPRALSGTPATRTTRRAPGSASGSTATDEPWQSISDYPTPIIDSAVGSQDGRVYSFGGSVHQVVPTPASYSYDPQALTWSRLADMPQARQKPVGGFVDGKFYVVAGAGPDTLPSATTLVYDPATDRWATAADDPEPRFASGSAVLDGKIYAVGGCTGECRSATSDVEVYDVATNRFHAAAPYPIPVTWESCGGIDGKVYCTGGLTTDLKKTSATFEYDPRTNTWTPAAALPRSLWGSAYAVANGQLVVSGGVTQDGTELTNETFAYDPQADAWASLPPAIDALYRSGAACGFTRVGGMVGAAVAPWTETLPAFDDCDPGGTDAAWLKEEQRARTIAPGHTATVTLTLDAGRVDQPGTYRALLTVREDTPYGAPSRMVTLNAAAPQTWAKLRGTVTGRPCSGLRAPLPGATVAIDRGHHAWTLTTGPDGRYALWVPGSSRRTTIVAAADHYRPTAAHVVLRPGTTRARNLPLKRLSC